MGEVDVKQNKCETCGGTGVEQSGVCHCGAEMEGHSLYDNHTATEMTRVCVVCLGSGVHDHKPVVISRCGGPTPEQLNMCGCGVHIRLKGTAWVAITEQEAEEIRSGI